MGRTTVTSLVVLASLLAGCGGGGSGTAIPSTATKSPQTVTFSLKLPGKATMARAHKAFYQSQGTQGVSIDWISTDPTKPDYAAPITFTCPAPTNYPAGVTSCGTVSGDTSYTFALAMLPGSYALTVTTFDAAPSNGSFTGAHQLSQGSVPVTINAGNQNSIPNITFYGVTSSISFEAKPSQSHAVPFNNGYAVIGNTPQAFVVNPIDAGGYIITGTGAPPVTVGESTTDPAQYFSIAQAGTTDEWDFTAKQAPQSATGSATITLSSGGFTPNVSVTPVQELWTTQTAGGTASAYGLNGYALFPPNFAPTTPIDFVFDNSAAPACSPSGCAWEPAAPVPDGSVVAIGVHKVYQFGAPGGSEGPGMPPAGMVPGPVSSPSPSNIAVDASGDVLITDNSFGELLIYPSISAVTGNPIATVSGLAGADAIAIAPAWSTIPASLRNTIWVGDYNSGGPVSAYSYATGSTTTTNIPVTFTSGAPSAVSTIGFDANGDLWINDGSQLAVYSLAGNASGVTLTQIATSNLPVQGTSFGATAQGAMYIGYSANGTLTTTPYVLSGGSITAGTPVTTLAPVFSSMVVP